MRGETAFDYRPTRARDGPREFLADFEGTLQRDSYQGYGGLSPGILHVGCWAHARRKLNEAKDSSPEQAHAAIRLIGKLYAIEKSAKELASDERRQLRTEKATPVLAALMAKLDAWQIDALPRSPLGKAIFYAKAQWETLVRYVDDGDVAIDNNAVYAARGISEVMPRPGSCRVGGPQSAENGGIPDPGPEAMRHDQRLWRKASRPSVGRNRGGGWSERVAFASACSFMRMSACR